MKYLRQRPQTRHLLTACPLTFLIALGAVPNSKADTTSSSTDTEPNSPGEKYPGMVEPGLSQRAVPSPQPPPAPPDLDIQTFQWFTHPFENWALMLPTAAPFSPADPSAFRPVTAYVPPLGLRPQVYRTGLVEWYPWFGLAQSYESNIQLTSQNEVSDFFVTPRFGLETQIGTPDSPYNESYDTILAAHLSYEGYADLFYQHSNLDAYNQLLNFSSRIGRSDFIVRPFASFSDITGSNIQINELQNRTERMQTTGGVVGEYNFTPVTSWRQAYTAFDFQHRDTAYINYDTWSTRQELSYLLPNDQTKAIVWAGAQTTDPDKGSSGNEYLAGAGWQAQFSPQLYSEIWLGWGELQMNGNVPGRENLSGIRYNGHTTFNYSPRLRFTLLYDRDYVYNELNKNDNYVSTLTQVRAEIYMGNNWFVMPYLGCGLDNYEVSRVQTLELRPEIEFSYVFSKEDYKIISEQDTMVGSRVFLKLGYDHIQNVRGTGAPVTDVRISLGLNWNL